MPEDLSISIEGPKHLVRRFHQSIQEDLRVIASRHGFTRTHVSTDLASPASEEEIRIDYIYAYGAPSETTPSY